MSTLALNPPLAPGRRDRGLAAVGIIVLLLVAAAIARHALYGPHPPFAGSVWMVIHLCSIVPALPLGAYVLGRRKGDRRHRISGRIWAGLMIVAALSSFGLVSLTGHLSPIHALSVLTLVAIPRAILNARAGRIGAHRRGMTIVYASMVTAGFFTFIPGRLLGTWLLGA